MESQPRLVWSEARWADECVPSHVRACFSPSLINALSAISYCVIDAGDVICPAASAPTCCASCHLSRRPAQFLAMSAIWKSEFCASVCIYGGVLNIGDDYTVVGEYKRLKEPNSGRGVTRTFCKHSDVAMFRPCRRTL